MKLWQQIGAVAVVLGMAFTALFVMDDRHLAASEKEGILVIVAQSSAALQKGVTANQLQLMQWELNDIIAREKAGKPNEGDASRKIILESRIKELAKK